MFSFILDFLRPIPRVKEICLKSWGSSYSWLIYLPLFISLCWHREVSNPLQMSDTLQGVWNGMCFNLQTMVNRKVDRISIAYTVWIVLVRSSSEQSKNMAGIFVLSNFHAFASCRLRPCNGFKLAIFLIEIFCIQVSWGVSLGVTCNSLLYSVERTIHRFHFRHYCSLNTSVCHTCGRHINHTDSRY